MGVMKNLLITIHNGGDEAVAAVQRMGDDWRAMLEQAAKEVETLRGDLEVMRLQRDAARLAITRLAEQDATLSVQGGNVTVTMDATFTDEERAALRWFAHYGLPEHRAATLRGLIDRTQTVKE
jgi:hypothetical protein